MPIIRVFIDWEKPFLAQACDWLFARYRKDTACNMHTHVVVSPGRRALRRCVQLLLERCERENVSFIPPKMASVTSLLDMLAGVPADAASSEECLFTWIEALRGFDKNALAVLAPVPPDYADISSWALLAERLHSMHDELAGAELRFCDVPAVLQTKGSFSDEYRWYTLATIQDRFQEILSSRGRKDRHVLRRESRMRTDIRFSGDIILLSTADLIKEAKTLLSRTGSAIFSLVHAPEAESRGFDELGAIIPSYWTSARIHLREDQYEIVEKIAHQARVLAAGMQERLPAGCPAEKVSIGVCDGAVSPYLTRELKTRGVATRDGTGTPLKRRSVFIMLKALQQFLALRQFHTFASLYRLPEIEAWTRAYFRNEGREQYAAAEYLTLLDNYQSAFLQANIGALPFGKGELGHAVGELYRALSALLKDLLGPKKAFSEWPKSIISFLARLYEEIPLPRAGEEQEMLFESLEAIRAAAEQCIDVAPSTIVSGGDGLALFLHMLRSIKVPSASIEEGVELLGWLELRLDDAPYLFVVGCNEGRLPETLNADPFLPDAVRRALGLLDNETRYARDAYALSSMVHSKEQLFLVGSHQNAKGERLLPSRLFYAGSREEVVRRVARIYANQKPVAMVAEDDEGGNAAFALPIPPAKEKKPLRAVPVSGIGAYLRCPYRFYLAYVLNLSVLDDAMLELDPLQFGTLGHAVLAAFGRSEERNSDDPETIAAVLHDLLDAQAASQFGKRALPAVLVQVEQLRERLAAFAKWQAEWRAQGWAIQEVEQSFDTDTFVLQQPEGALQITGRIDRIDYNPILKRHMVFDYKIGDAAKAPDRVHRKREEWVDLQLPMYLYYCTTVKRFDDVGAGYITLCADLEKLCAYEAGWSAEELSEAYNQMHAAARGILRQEFWPPADIPAGLDPYAILCGARQMEAPLSPMEEE